MSGAKRVVLCPGQGAQSVGMGSVWSERSGAARGVLERADEVLGDSLGAPLTRICSEGPDELLSRTDVSQPALYAVGVACWEGLLQEWGVGREEAGLVATAGLSLGEYTALHIAGAFSFEDGLRLVALRGRAMQDCADGVRRPDGSPGSGMVAIVGGEDAVAEEICDRARGEGVLVCANYNAPGQVVLSGSIDACERAVALAGERGVRATRLSVAGAFHSPIMAPAAERLREALAGTAIREPVCDVWSNVTGEPHAAGSSTIEESIRDRLAEQLTSPVRWSQGCSGLVDRVVRGERADGDSVAVHEVAPGRTLSGLMRRIERSVKVSSHDEPVSSKV